MNIIKKQIKYNITKLDRKLTDIKYLVIHYTSNYSKTATANMHFNYFNSGNQNASADFFVDENEILRINDYLKNYCWHVGDGHGKYEITNKNSIGIEICCNSDINKSIKNTVWLCRYFLQNDFKHIDEKHLVRHYDASRKLCPAFFVDLKIEGWNKAYTDFRKSVFAKESDEPYISGINVAFSKGIISSKKYWMEGNITKADLKQLFINMNKIG